VQAEELYSQLGKDFEVEKYTDVWGEFLDAQDFLEPAFTERWIGVMLNNAENINKVYTAVIPDTDILDAVLARDETDILLFSHHAMGYDPTLDGFPFYNIPVDHLRRLKERRISFYVMHAPLDRNGPYSTSMSLAKALELPVVSEFCEYLDCKVGVVCETDFKTVADLAAHVENFVGHEVKTRQYGSEMIENGTVAIAAGGGCIDFVSKELLELGISTYLTGVTFPPPSFEPGLEFHRIAEENRITIVGATHYSTEKFACMAMVDYFTKLGVEAEFVEGTPFMEDL